MIILACTKFISAARALLGIRGSVSGLPQMSVSKIETLLVRLLTVVSLPGTFGNLHIGEDGCE